MLLENIIDIISQSSQEVFDELGTGHSESMYHRAMEVELRLRSIDYSTRAPTELKYKGHSVGYSEPDLVIHLEDDKELIVELKATTYSPRSSEKAQLLGYLRARNCDVGLLINFPQPTANRVEEKVEIKVLKKSSFLGGNEKKLKNIPIIQIGKA